MYYHMPLKYILDKGSESMSQLEEKPFTKLSLEIKTEIDREEWNGFLQEHPQGHLLQSYEWGELLRYLGAKVYRLAAIQDGCMIGAMMLSLSDVPLPGLRLKWLYCCRGPAVDAPDSPALKALIEEAHAIARRERALILRLEPNITEDDPQYERWLDAFRSLGFKINPIAVHGRSSWHLDIRPALPILRSAFRKTWRHNIQKAERMGAVVRVAQSEEDFETYYRLLQLTSKRDDFFIHDKDYHREILRQFSENGNAALLIAEYQGEPVAAKLLIRYGHCCWDMFAGMTDDRTDLPKSHILQYHAILWAKEQGCTLFDFRTIPDNPREGSEMWGVYHFKKGFGGFPAHYLWTQDYIYRPVLYRLWREAVALRRTLRRRKHTH